MESLTSSKFCISCVVHFSVLASGSSRILLGEHPSLLVDSFQMEYVSVHLEVSATKKLFIFFATLTYISYLLTKSTVHNSAQCIFVTTGGLGQWRKWVDVVVTYQWRRQPPLGSLVTHHPPNISYTNSLALHSDSILICYILPTYLHWILVAGLAETESLQCTMCSS